MFCTSRKVIGRWVCAPRGMAAIAARRRDWRSGEFMGSPRGNDGLTLRTDGCHATLVRHSRNYGARRNTRRRLPLDPNAVLDAVIDNRFPITVAPETPIPPPVLSVSVRFPASSVQRPLTAS